jgi:hypothetical protein
MQHFAGGAPGQIRWERRERRLLQFIQPTQARRRIMFQ